MENLTDLRGILRNTSDREAARENFYELIVFGLDLNTDQKRRGQKNSCFKKSVLKQGHIESRDIQLFLSHLLLWKVLFRQLTYTFQSGPEIHQLGGICLDGA